MINLARLLINRSTRGSLLNACCEFDEVICGLNLLLFTRQNVPQVIICIPLNTHLLPHIYLTIRECVGVVRKKIVPNLMQTKVVVPWLDSNLLPPERSNSFVRVKKLSLLMAWKYQSETVCKRRCDARQVYSECVWCIVQH